MSDDLRAAIDVGSNTIRLLVARVDDGQLVNVLDASRFVRLGSGVDASGALNPERKAAGIEAIRELLTIAKDAGCRDVRAVATSAVRDARDGPEYVREIREETGLDVRVIDGAEEARLTFRGATVGIQLNRRTLLCDLGGGSCEIIAADSSRIEWERSLQLGSGRLTEGFIRHDPPAPQERDALRTYVSDTLSQLKTPHAGAAIFTGGTATHVALLLGLRDEVMAVNLGQLGEVEDLVYSLPASALAQEYGIRPERAAVLPAGITAIATIAGWSDASTLRITRHGIREGVLLSA